MACSLLQAAGFETRACRLPTWADAAFEAQSVVQGYEAWRCLSWEYGHCSDQISPVLRDYLHGTREITPGAYEAAQVLTMKARAEAQVWLQGFDVLLTPSAPDEAPVGLASTGPSTFNRLWTLLGVPCINVPGATGENGAPMGLQLIAPRGADARLLAAAQLLQDALGTHNASPHVTTNRLA
jgi:Asp-tRNA(Asn)/Glu-tRNA(Gln) amidotransferase A subunit family amidase